MKKILAAALLFSTGSVYAQATPVGLWKTIDDETKQERSLVRITDNGGVLVGKIEKLTDPGRASARCDKCEGAKKDQPIVGMAIIEGVKKNADEAYWDGGTVLDPESGKTYSCYMKLESANTMEVKGYIGFSLIGKSQTWTRVK